MDTLWILREHENVIVKHFGVKKVGVFGSFARGDAQGDSDVDILVEFQEGQKTFGNYMELKFYLEELFGREVDLVIETAIKTRPREHILKEAVYA